MSTATIAERVMGGLRVMTGCIPVPRSSRPGRVGPVKESVPHEGLELTIEPMSLAAEKGLGIVFAVTFRNVGSKAVVLPKDPSVQFVWIYSNGKRNDVVYDGPSASLCNPRYTVVLEPGETLCHRVMVATDGFRCRGITEFRAVFWLVSNAKPAGCEAWQGCTLSNSVGIMVDVEDEEDAWEWSPQSQQGLLAAER